MNVSLSVEVLPESMLRDVVDLLVRLVEAAGALIIFLGAVWAFGRFLLAGIRGGGVGREFNKIRLSLGRFLALGLEFQLAGDVLRTAIAPSFTEIGQLAAIAAIRTALNYFLSREIANERAEIERERRKEADDFSPPAGPA
ncbi:DUF1622 domain-containing protein [Streptomyces griseomycini]|uniref:Membrane protein n=1 Tax=Streptomyces griseomycini TaxID=66895 RepID=A0A7W7PY50_9ACTN|nr:DUF1622 domain-containing protein [Streptomyces griseomycini]MBB4903378.1 putative membrane protein [Streptomyces griseomycini]GGQ36132.1 hypothetical protein GCM10010266_69340 [Streptomyces griseomycini]GGR53803.1 hypothetical protein GCM10015536_68930 [Streptomyces griseomycini]